MDVIWGKREGIYFFRQDWTASISLIRFDKFAVTRSYPPTSIRTQ
jgi:hypothetical protein